MIAAADERLVRRALELAVAAPHTGDVPVGAVVLDADGIVLGRGRNEREAHGDPTAHAEVLALRAAAAALGELAADGCTLVVTLEPCTMCAGAIVLARVDRVVFGAWDAKAGAVGSLWDVVRDRRLNHRPEVVGGVLEDECAALLERSSPHRRLTLTARPVVEWPRCGRDSGCRGGDPVSSAPAVACPSGRRSTPRKRVRCNPPWVQIPPPPPADQASRRASRSWVARHLPS